MPYLDRDHSEEEITSIRALLFEAARGWEYLRQHKLAKQFREHVESLPEAGDVPWDFMAMAWGTGERLHDDGNFMHALLMYEKTIHTHPTGVTAYLGIAYMHIQQEQYEEALTILEKGYKNVKQDDFYPRISLLYVLADVHKFRKDNHSELAIVDEMIQFRSDDPPRKYDIHASLPNFVRSSREGDYRPELEISNPRLKRRRRDITNRIKRAEAKALRQSAPEPE